VRSPRFSSRAGCRDRVVVDFEQSALWLKKTRGVALHMLKSSSTSQQPIDVKAGLILAALFVAVWVLWDTPVVYPIKIFVVWLHELGHALAALLTGGQVIGIQIFPEEGGLTTTSGGWPFIILSAGYLGSLFFGALLLYLSSRRRWGSGLLIVLAVLLVVSTLLFFRNFFAVAYGLVAAAALFFCAYRLPLPVNFYIIRFIAVASCLYAVLDIRSDLFTAAPGQAVNDAVALGRLTGLPAIVWAVLWMLISLIALVYFLRSSLRVRDHE
jgi:hypothetical protein